MNQREFLKDLNIWGAILVSHGDELLHYSIPYLLKYCDKILLMQDNLSEKTRTIINKYKAKYPNIIELAESGFPDATEKQKNRPQGQLRRWKGIQGPVRERVFEYLREVHKNKIIDILLFPDEDEIFSDHLPKLLEDFWEKKHLKGVTIKPIDVFGDMRTVTGRSMTGHTRILKFFPELTGLNYRTGCYYRPLTKKDRMGCKFYTIHLCNLQTERFKWRVKNWKKGPRPEWGLWKLPNEAQKVIPSEIKRIINTEQDMTIEEYLGVNEKRMPMGVENADKALSDVDDLLKELGVRACVAFGTCVGLYRDGKLIRHDWDLDLMSLAEDNEKIENNQQKILDAGFTNFKRKQDIPKWKKEDGTMSDEKYVRAYSFKKYSCRIDIDPVYMSADGESRCVLKGRKREIFVGKFPKEMFNFNTMNSVEYNGKKYFVPTPTDLYLELNYGKTWDIPEYSHTPWHRRKCRRDYYELK